MNEINLDNIYSNVEIMPLDLGGWGGNHPIFNQLISWIKPSVIIEVGTWKGQSAINMCKSIKKLNLNTKIYCVDTWLGALEFWTYHRDKKDRDLCFKNGYPQAYFQFLSNVVQTNNQDTIIPLPMTSSIGAKYCKFFKIKPQLVYVDGSHEQNDVYRDIVDYWDILESGGVLFGDDYRDCWPGVIHDVNKFCKENSLEKNISETGLKWWIQKN